MRTPGTLPLDPPLEVQEPPVQSLVRTAIGKNSIKILPKNIRYNLFVANYAIYAYVLLDYLFLVYRLQLISGNKPVNHFYSLPHFTINSKVRGRFWIRMILYCK